MDFFTILLTIIVILFFAYYFYNKSNHFETYGIPNIKPLPLFGNMAPPIFCLTSFTEYTKKFYNLNKDAKYIGFFDFHCPAVMIRDPELVKDICIKHFDNFVNHRGFVDPAIDPLFGNNLFSLRDDRWREIRSILSPSFTGSKMKGMFELMSKCAETFASYWVENNLNDNLNVNSKDAFSKYTTDVIATCAFGITTDSLRNPNNEFYVYGMNSMRFQGKLALKFFVLRNFPRISKLFNVKLFDVKVEKFFFDIVRETIEVRDEKGITRPDMIQLMMETRSNNKSNQSAQLSIEDMTAQAFIFFLGGFDTTSSLMSFVAHQIAANEDIQQKLRAEVDEIYEKCNGNLTYDLVKNMEYLDAIINETQRMYPIAAFLDRVCNRDYELPPTLPGTKPYRLKVGSVVWIPVFGFHRDPAYFSDPDKFLPERFLSENAKSIMNSPTYVPFGIGPRICIGNRFALLEVKVLFFHLIHKCILKPGKKMKLPMKLQRGVSPTAQGGFWLDIVPRCKN